MSGPGPASPGRRFEERRERSSHRVLERIAPKEALPDRADDAATRFHMTLPQYRPSPLRELHSVALSLGLEKVWVKDETSRLGLPAFKILGASWAVMRALCDRYGIAPDPDLSTLGSVRERATRDRLTLLSATAGNHGRAVARSAALFGCGCHILVPQATAPQTIADISAEGATVEVVPGSYDRAVAECRRRMSADTLVISDTAWPGYERVPRDVSDGYRTIFREADAQLPDGQPPDLVLVQVGVGSFAVSALEHFQHRATQVVLVEARRAACGLESLRAGRPRSVETPPESLTPGINAGVLSALSFAPMWAQAAGCCTVDDPDVRAAVGILHGHRIPAAPTGASALAGLLSIARHHPGAFRGCGDGWKSVLVVVTDGQSLPAGRA